MTGDVMRRSLQFGALAACALIVVACGKDTADDAKSAGTSTTTTQPPPAPAVSPALLDAGAYPTKPRPPLGMSGNAATGALVESSRMADLVVGPWQADDKLITPYLSSFYVINTPDVLLQLGSEAVAAAARRHALIGGFASARQDTDKTVLVNAVLRFPDPAAAAAASTEMGAAATGQPIKGITATPLSIPVHPDAVASSYPFTPQGSSQARATVRSFTPHGPYVLMQFAQAIDGLDSATALVAKTIDAQGPRIDQFTPTADLAAVPLDATGLLARTLPDGAGGTAKNAVYGRHGAEHFQSNPIGSERLFSDAGVSEVAMGSTNVYQAKDEASAKTVTNEFSQEVSSGGTAPAGTVTALPDSHCWTLPKAFYCVAPAGRYAIEVQGGQLLDVHQQLAAQYVMLTT